MAYTCIEKKHVHPICEQKHFQFPALQIAHQLELWHLDPQHPLSQLWINHQNFIRYSKNNINIYVQSGINPAGDIYIYILEWYSMSDVILSSLPSASLTARFGTLASLWNLAAWHMIRQPDLFPFVVAWYQYWTNQWYYIHELHPYLWIKYIQPMITVLHVCMFVLNFCWLTPRVPYGCSPTMFDG